MKKTLWHFWNRQLRDYGSKTVLFSTFSTLVTLLFTIYNGILGIVYRSVWNGSICLYYLLLTGLRAVIVRAQNNCLRDWPFARRRRLYRVSHVILLLINLSLIAPAAIMITNGRQCTYGMIPAIAIAAYTTFRITISIFNYRRSRRNADPFITELRTINMIDSLTSVMTLQNTLISANGGMTSGLQTLSAWTSAVILTLSSLITLRSFRFFGAKAPDPHQKSRR